MIVCHFRLWRIKEGGLTDNGIQQMTSMELRHELEKYTTWLADRLMIVSDGLVDEYLIGDVEALTEGWIGMLRYRCKDGHIDEVTFDAANNPNKQGPEQVMLGVYATWYRCNGGVWIHNTKLYPAFKQELVDSRSRIGAEELWKKMMI